MYGSMTIKMLLTYKYSFKQHLKCYFYRFFNGYYKSQNRQGYYLNYITLKKKINKILYIDEKNIVVRLAFYNVHDLLSFFFV